MLVGVGAAEAVTLLLRRVPLRRVHTRRAVLRLPVGLQLFNRSILRRRIKAGQWLLPQLAPVHHALPVRRPVAL